MSEIIVRMKFSTLDSALTSSQMGCSETQTERNYGWDKLSWSKNIEVGHSPVRHLLTKPQLYGIPIQDLRKR